MRERILRAFHRLLTPVRACKRCGVPVTVGLLNGTEALIEYATEEPHSCVINGRYAPKEAKCV